MNGKCRIIKRHYGLLKHPWTRWWQWFNKGWQPLHKYWNYSVIDDRPSCGAFNNGLKAIKMTLTENIENKIRIRHMINHYTECGSSRCWQSLQSTIAPFGRSDCHVIFNLNSHKNPFARRTECMVNERHTSWWYMCCTYIQCAPINNFSFSNFFSSSFFLLFPVLLVPSALRLDVRFLAHWTLEDELWTMHWMWKRQSRSWLADMASSSKFNILEEEYAIRFYCYFGQKFSNSFTLAESQCEGNWEIATWAIRNT